MGRSVVRCSELQQACIALAVIAGEADAVALMQPDARCRIGDESYEVLVLCETTPATAARAEARRRAQRLSERGLIESEAVFLVAGVCVGDLNASPSEDVDVLEGESDETDLLVGPRATNVRFVPAGPLLERAA
jgi:hypothetical protein